LSAIDGHFRRDARAHLPSQSRKIFALARRQSGSSDRYPFICFSRSAWPE
jgi:hypothetical protein